MNEIDRKKLIGLLERMDLEARHEQRLCVIGAAALILLGRPARQTEDIDVWRPGSRLNDADLRRAAEQAGLTYDPKDDAPKGPYIQIVNPGIVNLPRPKNDVWPTGEESRVLWQGRRVTVVCPPPAILVAAKLVRASDVDLDDLMYLVGVVGVTKTQIEHAIGSFPAREQDTARENLDLLKVMMDQAERRRRRKRKDDQR